MGSLPLESIWHPQTEQTFPSTDLASLPASERQAAEPALSHAAPPAPPTHSVRAERDHVGPRGCPGLLLFLPPLQALPVFSSSKEGLPLVPSFPLGFGEAPAFSWEVNALPSGLRPLSASRPLVRVPSAPDSTREASSPSSVQMTEPPRTCLENAAYAQLWRHSVTSQGI